MTYATVDEAIAALNDPNQSVRWPGSRDGRMWMLRDNYIGIRVNQSAKPEDGFGWSGLHMVEGSGHVSASGYHRCKRRAFAMKECKPFAVKLLVWNAEKAMTYAKANWHRYSDEEKKELEEHLTKAFFKSVNLKQVRRESPFAQWSERASALQIAA